MPCILCNTFYWLPNMYITLCTYSNVHAWWLNSEIIRLRPKRFVSLIVLYRKRDKIYAFNNPHIYHNKCSSFKIKPWRRFSWLVTSVASRYILHYMSLIPRLQIVLMHLTFCVLFCIMSICNDWVIERCRKQQQ